VEAGGGVQNQKSNSDREGWTTERKKKKKERKKERVTSKNKSLKKQVKASFVSPFSIFGKKKKKPGGQKEGRVE